MSEETNNDTQNEGVRDFDPLDFDENGELKNETLAAHYEAERAKMLGQPVASEKQNYSTEPPTVEKADPNEKPVINRGDGADYLAKRYSAKQLKDLADELGVEYKDNTPKANLALAVQKAWAEQNPETDGANTLNTLPANPEQNAPETVTEAGVTQLSTDELNRNP